MVWQYGMKDGCEEILPKLPNLLSNVLMKGLGRERVHTIMCISGFDSIPSIIGYLPLVPTIYEETLSSLPLVPITSANELISTDFSGMDNDSVIRLLVHEVQKRSSNTGGDASQANERIRALNEEINALRKQKDSESARMDELRGLLSEKESRISLYA
jgi:predicted metallopeptidase